MKSPRYAVRGTNAFSIRKCVNDSEGRFYGTIYVRREGVTMRCGRSADRAVAAVRDLLGIERISEATELAKVEHPEFTFGVAAWEHEGRTVNVFLGFD